MSRRKHVKTLCESRKQVQEIRKSRQLYMPVIALPPGASEPSASQPAAQTTFRYDRKDEKKRSTERDRRKKKEEVGIVLGDIQSEFAYAMDVATEDELKS